jgi:hypothetical protein
MTYKINMNKILSVLISCLLALQVHAAAITFPNSPADQEEYAAENGVIYKYTTATTSWRPIGVLGSSTLVPMSIALGDNDTALTTGQQYEWYSPPYAITITDIEYSLQTAPTGAEFIADLHDDGVTIMGTNKLDIDVTEFHTKDAGTQPAISAGAIAASSVLTFHIDQIGSTIAGAGPTIYFYYTVD